MSRRQTYIVIEWNLVKCQKFAHTDFFKITFACMFSTVYEALIDINHDSLSDAYDTCGRRAFCECMFVQNAKEGYRSVLSPKRATRRIARTCALVGPCNLSSATCRLRARQMTYNRQ